MAEAAVVDTKNFVQDCYEIGDADDRVLLKSSDLAIRGARTFGRKTFGRDIWAHGHLGAQMTFGRGRPNVHKNGHLGADMKF